jgi:hypothetical protein
LHKKYIGYKPYLVWFCLPTTPTGGRNPAQLDTITEFLGIPNYKVTHVIDIRKRKVSGITTAISEGINNKIKRLSRMAYGFKDVHYFLLKIHQHCGMLNPRFSA